MSKPRIFYQDGEWRVANAWAVIGDKKVYPVMHTLSGMVDSLVILSHYGKLETVK